MPSYDDNSVTNVTAKLGRIVGEQDDPPQVAVLESDVPGVRHAVAATAEKGLQVERIDVQTDFPFPVRARGTRNVSELPSFLDELTRRPLTKGDGTLWGDYTKGRITAVYDDHPGRVVDGASAGWREDRLTLTLVKDPDWAAWQAISGQYMGQETFGDKVEELLHTVITPSQADLMEVIASVRASTSGEFESRIERHNGSQKLLYKQDVTTKAGKNGELEVPQFVTLLLRPWEGHTEAVEVEAYFRLRVREGGLALCIHLKPTTQLIREAWSTTTLAVAEHTGIPVLAQRNADA